MKCHVLLTDVIMVSKWLAKKANISSNVLTTTLVRDRCWESVLWWVRGKRISHQLSVSVHISASLRDNVLCSNYSSCLCFHCLLQQVASAVRAGVNPSGNSFNQTSLWDISSSFFFAGTVITTIGRCFFLNSISESILLPHSIYFTVFLSKH